MAARRRGGNGEGRGRLPARRTPLQSLLSWPRTAREGRPPRPVATDAPHSTRARRRSRTRRLVIERPNSRANSSKPAPLSSASKKVRSRSDRCPNKCASSSRAAAVSAGSSSRPARPAISRPCARPTPPASTIAFASLCESGASPAHPAWRFLAGTPPERAGCRTACRSALPPGASSTPCWKSRRSHRPFAGDSSGCGVWRRARRLGSGERAGWRPPGRSPRPGGAGLEVRLSDRVCGQADRRRTGEISRETTQSRNHNRRSAPGTPRAAALGVVDVAGVDEPQALAQADAAGARQRGRRCRRCVQHLVNRDGMR